MLFTFEIVALVIIAIWLTILSFFIWKMTAHYNNLTKGISTKTLKSILDHLLRQIEETQQDIDSLVNRCATMEKDNLLHIQKVGLLRFNPFKDTGGDQSFIIELINAHDTGIVISGLYSRSGTRWYAKRVIEGKGVDHELSDEEKKAIKEAKAN